METKDVKPSDTYEGLKTQFFAMRRLLASKEVEVEIHRKYARNYKVGRIIELEAELESEREMNSILTEELSQYEKQG